MQPFDNCAACACMQAWRLAASWITELQSLWASPVQAARTAAVAAGAGWMAARLSAKTTKAAANGWLRIIGFPRIWPVGGHPV